MQKKKRKMTKVSKIGIKLQFPYPTEYEYHTAADYSTYNTTVHRNRMSFALNVAKSMYSFV